MIPWADKVAGPSNAQYKAATQGWWAVGAIIGAIAGAELASRLGRRRSYLLISIGATVLTISMFTLTAPLEPALPRGGLRAGCRCDACSSDGSRLYLPEIFPVQVRATGSGLGLQLRTLWNCSGCDGGGILVQRARR